MEVIKIHNDIRANFAASPPEGLYVIQSSNTVEAITSDASLYFTKLWLYAGSAVSATGVITVNGASILLGKSGAAANIAALASLIVTAGEALATSAAHGFLAGQNITIGGATPSALNAPWPIYGVQPDTFKFRSASGTALADGPATGTITAARTKYLPWLLAAGDANGMVFEMPLGQRMRLSEIIIRGTAGDGVHYSFT